ncbi:MAG: DNA primase [Patescibacteria group bacterium]
MDSVEEIKQKLDIATVVGEYVPLHKAGSNFKARCPFHNEKSPSFFVTPDRQIWHCFGCNEGGDMFTFIQKIEGIEFPEALKLLAQKAGVQLKQFDPRVTSQKNRLHEVCQSATQYWQECLKADVGKIAREYIAKRKIQDKTLVEFKLGFAPDSWDATMKSLMEKGYTESEIFQAGLSVRKEKGTGYYDRFRDRLMFPIQDIHGNVIGFTARTLKADEPAKYINTPESVLYHKSSVLYALDKAKKAIRENNYVIIVEGNMDAITAHEAGYKNVVACSGTALTIEQINLLKRYTNNFALCFDQDEAGQKAAERSIDLLFGAEVNTKIVQVLTGKDPDECIKNNPLEWESSLRQSKDVMKYYFDKYLTVENLSNVTKKKLAVKVVLTQIAKIKNKIEQDHWIKQLANILQVESRLLWESLPQNAVVRVNVNSPVNRKNSQANTRPQNPIKVGDSIKTENLKLILTILLNYPKHLAFVQEYLLPEMIEDEGLSGFYKIVLSCYNQNQQIEKEQLIRLIEAENKIISGIDLNSLILSADNIYDGFTASEIDQELFELLRVYRRGYISGKLEKLRQELAQAEQSSDLERKNKLSKEIDELNFQRQKLQD